MQSLGRMLHQTFAPPAPRKKDAQRKAREQAKPLIKRLGIDLEKCDSGWNVWPPKSIEVDPFDGDHYAQDWNEVLLMAQRYADTGTA